MKSKPLTAILLIATHKYKQFIPQMLESLKKHFKMDYEVVLFTDAPDEWIDQVDQVYKIQHFLFPYPSLYRFKYFLSADLSKYDYVYYMDIDSRLVADVHPKDIHSDLVAVHHCGFYFHPERIKDNYELNPNSLFYGITFNQYFCGGMQGGKTSEYLKACKWCDEKIDQDLLNGVWAIHHDESWWNAYLVENKPTKILGIEFHYPQDFEYFVENCWDGKNVENPKVLLLKKDHEEIRG